MFEEFAIDPASFVQWEYFKELRDKFGLDKGRLIADFPHKGWKKGVARLINESRERPNPIRNVSTIEAWLRAPDGRADSRFVKSKRPFDSDKLWGPNALEQACSFHAVLSEEALPADNAIQLTETACLSEHPLFKIETMPRISRTDEALIEIAKPLLRYSREVKWVDRYFDPGDKCKTGPLIHMLRWMREEVPQLHEIELHVERSENFGQNTKDYYSRKLEEMLPEEFLVRVFFWKTDRENLHPRFLLTDVGGLQYDYGLDRGNLNLPEETTIVSLVTVGRLKDEWRRYSLATQDLDPNVHVLKVPASE